MAASYDFLSKTIAWTSPFPDRIGFAVVNSNGQPPQPLPEELALLSPAASERRRRDFFLGRAAAHRAMANLDGVGSGNSAMPVTRREGRMPRWPTGIVGAITHTSGMAAAAAAHERDYRGIGLDVDTVREPSPRLLRRILRAEEQGPLSDGLWGSLARRFTVYFCAKECIYKAVNPLTGVYLGFHDARVELSEPEDTDSSADESAGARGRFRWTVLKECGVSIPEGFQGEGRYLVDESVALCALWITANPDHGM